MFGVSRSLILVNLIKKFEPDWIFSPHLIITAISQIAVSESCISDLIQGILTPLGINFTPYSISSLHFLLHFAAGILETLSRYLNGDLVDKLGEPVPDSVIYTPFVSNLLWTLSFDPQSRQRCPSLQPFLPFSLSFQLLTYDALECSPAGDWIF